MIIRRSPGGTDDILGIIHGHMDGDLGQLKEVSYENLGGPS